MSVIMPLKSFDLYEEEVTKNSTPPVTTLFNKYKKGRISDDNSVNNKSKTNQKMFKQKYQMSLGFIQQKSMKSV